MTSLTCKNYDKQKSKSISKVVKSFKHLGTSFAVDYLNHLPAGSEDRENVESKNTSMLLMFIVLLLVFVSICVYSVNQKINQ